MDCKGGEARRRRRERNAIREERDEERKARAGKEAAGDKTFFDLAESFRSYRFFRSVHDCCQTNALTCRPPGLFRERYE